MGLNEQGELQQEDKKNNHITPKGRRRSIRKELINLGIKTILILLVVFFVHTYVLTVIRCSGNAMYPSVKDGDLTAFYKLDRGYGLDDVIYFRDAEGKNHIGRIVALPGQTITFHPEGGYAIDGLDPGQIIPYETFYPEELTEDFSIQLGDDEYYILHLRLCE